MSLLCSIQNSTQFSTPPAQNALTLTSPRALVSLTEYATFTAEPSSLWWCDISGYTSNFPGQSTAVLILAAHNQVNIKALALHYLKLFDWLVSPHTKGCITANTLGRWEMAAILQITISNAFYWKKNVFIFIYILLQFVLDGPLVNKSALVPIRWQVLS